MLILSSNVVNKKFSGELIPTEINGIELAVDNFISALEKRLAITFQNKKKLKTSLIQHLVPAIYRNLLGLQIINPLADQFIAEHDSVNRIVEQEMHYFGEFISKIFSKEEIAYITMIVLSNLIDNHQLLTPKTFTGVVICKSGTSVSKLLTEQLKFLFPSIEFGEVMSVRQFEEEGSTRDFIFSTVPISNKENVFLVSSFMSLEEKKGLKESVTKAISVDNQKKTKQIISYLSEYLKEDSEDEAAKKLQEVFSNEERETKLEFHESFLNSISQVSIITKNVDWEDLISLSFKKLLERNSITSNYLEVCEKIFKEFYDSLLISPGVLIPHASTDEGVNSPDVQISLFRKPIIGPNNKEYRLVIALAPGENNEHLNWLIELNNKLLNIEFRNQVFNAPNKETLLNLLQENEDGH